MIKYISALLLSLGIFQSSPAQRIPLTQEMVKSWIENRVKAHDLQMEFKANEDKYDEVIKSYFTARNEMLNSNGWESDEFDATGEWIYGVLGSIESQKELDDEKAMQKEQFAEFDALEHLSDEQKEQMRTALLESTVQRQDYIDVFKEDWPAVEPYLKALNELDDYIGGSRSAPPAL
ncbi:MAG: hypothetical protein AAGC47_01110 [Bacteroidota bacterium]